MSDFSEMITRGATQGLWRIVLVLVLTGVALGGVVVWAWLR
jgi:hypothetical protein